MTRHNTPHIIAEIGCNHKGDFAIAEEMVITAAIFCKVDIVKFQKRNNRELLSQEQYIAPHPDPRNSYGPTYGAHREYLEFDIEQHRSLKALCESSKVDYSSSVWDETSAKEISSLAPKMIKIPSACNQNRALLDILINEYSGQIHISLGMTTRKEEERLVRLIDSRHRLQDTVLYACTSGYPVPFEDIHLLEIRRLVQDYSSSTAGIGFSGHHLGIAVDSAAIALGASWIERHFTLNRTWKGTDHAASLEPDGMRRVVRDCKAISQALTSKPEEILSIEIEQRRKLKEGQIKWIE